MRRTRWFDDFMETYLSNAANLRRNDLSMLPWLGPVMATLEAVANLPLPHRPRGTSRTCRQRTRGAQG